MLTSNGNKLISMITEASFGFVTLLFQALQIYSAMKSDRLISRTTISFRTNLCFMMLKSSSTR
ncbi:hypothetical protein X975_23843, partial [Stegodyphus mimosarum]